jgi:hypothetical protein
MRPKSIGRQGVDQEIADFGIRLPATGRLKRHFGRVVLDIFYDRHDARQARLTCLCIDRAADIVLCAVARARGFLDRILHRIDHDRAVDRLLARDSISNLQQFNPVRTDTRNGHCLCVPLALRRIIRRVLLQLFGPLARIRSVLPARPAAALVHFRILRSYGAIAYALSASGFRPRQAFPDQGIGEDETCIVHQIGSET